MNQITNNTYNYKYGQDVHYLYNLIWNEFCYWYIQITKIALYGEHEIKKQTTRSVLAHVLDHTLRMLHPYMPFITEEIWQQLPHEGPSITVAAWPIANKQFQNNQASEEMERIVAAIKAVRNIRSEVNTPMSKKVSMMIQTNKASVTEELEKNRHYIERFCNVESLSIAENMEIPEQAMTAVITGAEVILPLE